MVYVAHLPSMDMLSPGAVAEMESSFDEIERDLRTAAAEQLRGLEEGWGFERRQGMIADQLIAAAKDARDAHPGDRVIIVAGVRRTPPTAWSVRSPSAWPATRRYRS